jgi:mannosylglucosylglycerate synthase
MKICIAHFRMGLLDGVSLQIDERMRILQRLGHEVSTIASTKSLIGDLKIPYFEYKENEAITRIQNAAFGVGAGAYEFKLREDIDTIAAEIEYEITEFWDRRQFSLLFVHNMFSLPVCLPATVAFYNFLKNHPKITAVGVHHDFYWDPPRKDLFKTGSETVNDLLSAYLPPVLPNLKHAVISKWEQAELKRRRNIDSLVMTDTFDFEQKLWRKNDSNKDYLADAGIGGDDLVLLIASRIRPRKGIELGIEFTAEVNRLLEIGTTGLKKTRAVLVLPNDYMEKEEHYVSLLKNKAAGMKVEVKWMQNLVGSEEEKLKGIKKYSLWDTYVYADAILYPSLWEGFGNQFLEAIFAKKPVVTLEYPVYKTDIDPAGFEVGKIADNVTIDGNGLAVVTESKLAQPVQDLITLLEDKSRVKEQTDRNFRIAKENFNTKSQLRGYLTEISGKYVLTRGLKNNLSPLLLSGKLVACGVPVQNAYNLAELIIDQVPEKGVTGDEFFRLILENLHNEIRERYITIELGKEYLVSDKCNSPLFIFIGGMAGKTTLSNFVVQQLGISQPIVFDNEKYRIAKPGKSKPFLWKATYETKHGYERTTEVMYPYLAAMIERNLFDYKRYKKWCYFWEGIYLSSGIVQRLHGRFPGINYFSVFNLPKLDDIKKQYILRWQNELGAEKLEKKKNVIDRYLENVSAIRSHIAENLDPVASFVIESSVLEERLNIFYTLFYQRIKDITDKEIPGWVERVSQNPGEITEFRKFLAE